MEALKASERNDMATLDKNKVKLGIAPIGWTNDDMPELGKENTFQQTISEMALAGFKGSEVGSHYPTDKYELKKALDLRDMVIYRRFRAELQHPGQEPAHP